MPGGAPRDNSAAGPRGGAGDAGTIAGTVVQGAVETRARRAADAVASLPRDVEGPVFREPWEAQAFAMAVLLHDAGLFAWTEWAQALHREIDRAQSAGDPDRGDTYYRHWLAALEDMLAQKGVASAAELARLRRAWKHAAERTPHGMPITLLPEDSAAQ
jgi:nitrile hydratase accessory protein